MRTCEQTGCAGHLGKFGSCLEESLWEWALDVNDYTGSSDFDGWYALVIVDQDTVVESEAIADSEPVVVPAGNYVVHEHTSGFVTVASYDTRQEADEAFERAQDAYAAWDEQED